MEFTPEELAAIRSEYAKGATDAQFALFMSECKSRALRPGQHLIFQLRRTKEYDPDTNASVFVQKPYWITTVSALRLIIERTGKYAGQTAPEYIYLDDAGNPSVVSTIPLPKPGSTDVPREPWAVRVGIKRKDFDEPIIGMARFEAVAGTVRSGNGVVLSSMWAKRGPEMCAKCAEADGIRKAAPEEAGSFYIAEELKNEPEELQSLPQQQLAPAPTAPVVPVVNQTPAEPTETPRPNTELPAVTLTEDGDAVVPKTRKPRGKKVEPPVGDHGITDADIEDAAAHVPETPEEEAQRKAEAQAFVEEVSSVTPVPDRIPEKDKLSAYVARMREFVKTQGVDNKKVGEYVFKLADKKSSKELTIGDWDKAFEKLDSAASAGTLKELIA